MNIEVICPVCGKESRHAVTVAMLNSYQTRIFCGLCRKSFFLNRAEYKIVAVEDYSVEREPTHGQYTGTVKTRRSKWGRKAYGDVERRIKQEKRYGKKR